MKRGLGVIVAFVAWIAGAFWYIHAIKEQPSQHLIGRQYARLEELQRRVGGGGLEDLRWMKPPQDKIGIEYKIVTRKRDDGGELSGIEIVDVYRDSSAGRAGVLPGDRIAIIGENGVCNALFARDDSPEHRVLAERNLKSKAMEFFEQAPDHFTLTVLRDNKELKFNVVRGPIAPELVAYLDQNLPLFEKRLAASKPLVDKLVADWVKDPTTQAELEKREQDLQMVEDAVNEPWGQVNDFRRPLMVQ